MNKSDFWTSYAEAMELSIEGNRLIANEIVDLARGLWQRIVRGFDGMLQNLGQRGHLPPV
jgi:hypothetical protein